MPRETNYLILIALVLIMWAILIALTTAFGHPVGNSVGK